MDPELRTLLGALAEGQVKLTEGQVKLTEGQVKVDAALERLSEKVATMSDRLDRFGEMVVRGFTRGADQYSTIEERVNRLEQTVYGSTPPERPAG